MLLANDSLQCTSYTHTDSLDRSTLTGNPSSVHCTLPKLQCQFGLSQPSKAGVLVQQPCKAAQMSCNTMSSRYNSHNQYACNCVALAHTHASQLQKLLVCSPVLYTYIR
eukprot:GHRR01008866.1.p1 GENE.GHRR01008866.1~~GHRR01008866.1.p1  ORF type:complete len:109 (-),score=18.36 GHRR01008866.1:321-647(-)